jgi:hypothetical protein
LATGQTLCVFLPQNNEPPASNYATVDDRNGHKVLDFDATMAEGAVFSAVLPRHYAGGGITFYVHYSMSSATTGTCGWTVEVERVGDGSQDVDSDGFASAQTVTAVTVPGTSGHVDIANVAVSDGANIDSIAVGEKFRVRLKRDVANDTATGDAEFHALELKET